jgi:hypothetical protein
VKIHRNDGLLVIFHRFYAVSWASYFGCNRSNVEVVDAKLGGLSAAQLFSSGAKNRLCALVGPQRIFF